LPGPDESEDNKELWLFPQSWYTHQLWGSLAVITKMLMRPIITYFK
jgi:hypothetical protein